jgi:hypothetical protein
MFADPLALRLERARKTVKAVSMAIVAAIKVLSLTGGCAVDFHRKQDTTSPEARV